MVITTIDKDAVTQAAAPMRHQDGDDSLNAEGASRGTARPNLVKHTLGRRIEKKDHVTSANTRRYFYSKDWQVLDEYNFSDTLACRQAEPARSKLGMGALTMPSNSIAQRAIPQFCTFSFAFCISADHLYSVAAEINTSSAVTERYEYDAYGQPHVLDADFSDDSDNLPDDENPYLFTGRRVDFLDDNNLKLQYNRNRYYDYHTGRWLTHDPLGYVDGLNVYAYVRNEPLGHTDPLGLRSCSSCRPASASRSINVPNWSGMSLYPRIWPIINPILRCAECWTAEQAVDGIVRNELDAAWKHFTRRSGTTGNVRLSDADMATVFTQYEIRKKIIQPLIDECARTQKPFFDRKTIGLDYESYGYAETAYSLDGSWGATLGGVGFKVAYSCNCRELVWDVWFRDSFDFNNRWRGWRNLSRNVLVTLVGGFNGTLNCGWQDFDHYGAASGKESIPCK